MVKFFSYFDSNEWIFDKEENGIKMEYRVFEEERTIAVRMEAEIDI